MQAELEALTKVFDENEDPATTTIKENLIAAINYEEPEIMTEINLRTRNGESALSMAAKHGFSNAVKFFILAVSHNHLKVVQVLFEDWISPNSHEKTYLHLSPIFNVKSREIAQVLIDNDAVTHEIYNNKNQSPLTVACQNGYRDVVEFFLDDGLDINHLDNDNKTPLFYALANKHHEIANLLISQGAQNELLHDQSMPKRKY
jgi:ankyrin repeat protein